MSSLKPSSALNGFSKNYDEISIEEISDLSIISLAIPNGREAAFAKSVKTALKVDIPTIGNSTLSKNKKTRLLGLQKDMIFAIVEGYSPDPISTLPKSLGKSVYMTNQSDNWCALRIKGPKAIEALQRICQIDIRPHKFKINQIARTQMEHLGAIIICEAPGQFLLLSASSSAKSFLHAVTVSAENVS